MAENKSTKKPIFTDKRTRDKIDLHLSDINDEITEEDIENVKTDVTTDTDSADDIAASKEASELLDKHKREDKRREDGNNSNEIQTPWNVLD